MEQPGQPPDRRLEPRTTKISDHRAEFKFTGVPVYQLKVRDLSAKGVGVVARTDSNFLKMIQVGQELDIRLIPAAKTTGPSEHYRSRMTYI
jgi:hypothetical protein